MVYVRVCKGVLEPAAAAAAHTHVPPLPVESCVWCHQPVQEQLLDHVVVADLQQLDLSDSDSSQQRQKGRRQGASGHARMPHDDDEPALLLRAALAQPSAAAAVCGPPAAGPAAAAAAAGGGGSGGGGGGGGDGLPQPPARVERVVMVGAVKRCGQLAVFSDEDGSWKPVDLIAAYGDPSHPNHRHVRESVDHTWRGRGVNSKTATKHQTVTYMRAFGVRYGVVTCWNVTWLLHLLPEPPQPPQPPQAQPQAQPQAPRLAGSRQAAAQAQGKHPTGSGAAIGVGTAGGVVYVSRPFLAADGGAAFAAGATSTSGTGSTGSTATALGAWSWAQEQALRAACSGAQQSGGGGGAQQSGGGGGAQ